MDRKYKHLLCSLGFSGIWYTQSFLSSNWLIKTTKQKIKDIYIQDWNSTLSISSSSNNYRLFKDTFETSHYHPICVVDFLPSEHGIIDFRWKSADGEDNHSMNEM